MPLNANAQSESHVGAARGDLGVAMPTIMGIFHDSGL